MAKDFEEKVVLVTGGGSGIGAATAKLLASRGARVVITGREEPPLKAVIGGNASMHAVLADVSKTSDAARTIAEVKSKFGRLDVLVNNAGIAPIASLAGSTPELVKRVFDTNVLGVVELTREALPLLKQSKGAVVNVATTVADEPFPNFGVYCASKAAVLALTRAWAQELAAEGVRVNAVSPGPIETPLFTPDKLGITQSDLQSMATTVLGLVPSKRFGKPEEVANVIAFLASGGASFVTGAQYTVGGGIEA